MNIAVSFIGGLLSAIVQGLLLVCGIIFLIAQGFWILNLIIFMTLIAMVPYFGIHWALAVTPNEQHAAKMCFVVSGTALGGMILFLLLLSFS